MTNFWEGWETNKDTPLTEFQFAWSPKGKVCGQLSSSHGQGWDATLAGADAVSVFMQCFCYVSINVHDYVQSSSSMIL